MTGVTCIMAGGSASSNFLDTQVVTSAVVGPAGSRVTGYISGSQGSIVDGTSNIYGGAAILAIYNDQTTNLNYLQISGTLANFGWSTMTCVESGVTLNRVNATFSGSGPGGSVTWTWSTVTYGVLFSGTGNKTINFN